VNSKYLKSIALSLLMLSATSMAAERSNNTHNNIKTINKLIKEYKASSSKNAYKRMNEIKSEIAKMAMEQQHEAITMVESAISYKNHKMEEAKKKRKEHMAKRRKIVSKSMHPEHMNPIDAMGGITGGVSGSISGSIGGMSGGMSGGMGGF